MAVPDLETLWGRPSKVKEEIAFEQSDSVEFAIPGTSYAAVLDRNAAGYQDDFSVLFCALDFRRLQSTACARGLWGNYPLSMDSRLAGAR